VELQEVASATAVGCFGHHAAGAPSAQTDVSGGLIVGAGGSDGDKKAVRPYI
jgi:hypothetical protein